MPRLSVKYLSCTTPLAHIHGSVHFIVYFSNKLLHRRALLSHAAAQSSSPTLSSYLFFTVLLILGTQSATAQVYQMTDLGTLGGSNTFARGINSRGEVVGDSEFKEGVPVRHAFLFSNGIMKDLTPTLTDTNGKGSLAFGINNLGIVVGAAPTSGCVFGPCAVMWRGGTMTDLGMGGHESYATGVNDIGQIVGWNFGRHPTNVAFWNSFLWENGSLTLLQDILFSETSGINNKGQVIGQGGNNTSIWENGAWRSIGTLSGEFCCSVPRGINDLTQVVGNSPAGNNTRHAFFYDEGAKKIRDLGTLGGANSFALAVNNLGQAVGYSQITTGNTNATHAFLYSNGEMIDLNNRIINNSGWELIEATGINDSGQIAVTGRRGDQHHAFLLTPAEKLVTPNNGGNNGIVDVTIIFPGLQPESTVQLFHHGSAVLDGKMTAVFDFSGTYILKTTFNLLNTAPGTYDILVTLPSGERVTIQNGFTVEDGGSPDLWLNIVGRDVIRWLNEEDFYVYYGNKGNVTTHDSVLVIRIPKGIPVKVKGLLSAAQQPPFDYFDLGDEILILIWIYKLPPGATNLVTLGITVPLVFRDLSIDAELIRAPQSEFTLSGDFDYMPYHVHLIGDAVAKTLAEQRTMQHLLNVSRVSKGSLEISESPCVNYEEGDNIDRCAELVQNNVRQGLRDTRRLLDPTEYGVGTSLSIIGNLQNEVGFIGNFTSLIMNLKGVYDAGQAAQRALDRHHTIVRGAMDPNEIIGPHGAGNARWISDETPLNYVIFFENLPEATLPARDVFITAQLDVANLDLSTFRFGQISLGDKFISFPPGPMFEFSSSIMSSERLLVRVIAKLNTVTGLVSWHFLSIDPATGRPPEDPLVGFLHPGEGGNVHFSINPKQELLTGTVIKERASIVFDVNPPLDTNEWLNTTDNSKPTSRVLPVAAIQPLPTFTVKWVGADDGSGVRDFTVYVSDNGGPFTPWLTQTTSTQAAFTGVPHHTYSFFSVARDLTNNLENAKIAAEATTRVVSNRSPTAKARNITVAAGSSCQARVSPKDFDAGSFDPDGDEIILTLTPVRPFDLGSHAVVLTSTDIHGASDSVNATITVVDQTPPEITNVSPNLSFIWPPNRRMVDVLIGYNPSDNCGPTISRLNVSSNEPLQSSDVEIVDAHHLRLRADRRGDGNGRTYTVTIFVIDGYGNLSRKDVLIDVSHDQRK